MRSAHRQRQHRLAATAFATQLMVLIEGVYASAQSLGADRPARSIRALVETLLPDR